MKKTIVPCDLCWLEKYAFPNRLQVIFMTDQEEGRSTTPYIENENLDICRDCYFKVLKWAMWYNDYSFTKFWQWL